MFFQNDSFERKVVYFEAGRSQTQLFTRPAPMTTTLDIYSNDIFNNSDAKHFCQEVKARERLGREGEKQAGIKKPLMITNGFQSGWA